MKSIGDSSFGLRSAGSRDCTYHYSSGAGAPVGVAGCGQERSTRASARLFTGSAEPIKDYVWGLAYIDEAVQTRINTNPTGTASWNAYWVMQDANYNVLGVVDSSGVLGERYEYTPYGERHVFASAGSNDPGCYAPQPISTRVVTSGSVTQPYGLCEIGHQGLMHDEEAGVVYGRARLLNPTLGRWNQADPLGYVDSLNVYLDDWNNPEKFTDAFGLSPTWEPNWRRAGAISIKKQLFEWQDLRPTGKGIWGPGPDWHQSKADFEVGVHTVYDLEIVLLGPTTFSEPSVGNPNGSPRAGGIYLPGIWSTDGWSVLNDGLLRQNKGKLAGKTCRKKLYLVQSCNRCGVDGTVPRPDGKGLINKSVSETKDRYIEFYIPGTLKYGDMHEVFCDAEDVEKDVANKVKQASATKFSLCNNPKTMDGKLGGVVDFKPGDGWSIPADPGPAPVR